ncbi:MAG: helix-turn-helix domain-containing protein [Chloroflexota bacterium]
MNDVTRRRPLVGTQIRRRRADRSLTLAAVAARTGLNIGYLSQLENDKASPSLETLAALAEALDVPITWFLLDPASAPRVVRAGDRPHRKLPRGSGSMSQVDGGLARDIAIFQGSMPPGHSTGYHAHPGDEHHIVLAGRVRITQGDHVIDAGPGDYVLIDGTIAHNAEAIGEAPADLLIVYPRGGHSEFTRALGHEPPPGTGTT